MGVDPLATIMALPEPTGFAGGVLSVSSEAGPLTLAICSAQACRLKDTTR